MSKNEKPTNEIVPTYEEQKRARQNRAAARREADKKEGKIHGDPVVELK